MAVLTQADPRERHDRTNRILGNLYAGLQALQDRVRTANNHQRVLLQKSIQDYRMEIEDLEQFRERGHF